MIIKNLIFTCLCLVLTTDAAKILALLPFPAHSHQMNYQVLTTALAARGHQLTVFTADPLNKTITNYTEYSLSNYYSLVSDEKIKYFDVQKNGLFWHLSKVYKTCGFITDDILSNPIIKGYMLPNSTEQFDLILLSSGYWDALFYLSDKLQAPLIFVSSLPGLSVEHYQIGNPMLPAEFPDALLGYSNEMNFWERMNNFYHMCRQIYEYHSISQRQQTEILDKHFGTDHPPVSELHSRISMSFFNTHPLLHYSRPMSPRVVQYAGLRIGNMNTVLPEKLETLLNNAKQGFIYFSLGTNLKISHLKQELLIDLIEIFSELPYLIVWKCDAGVLPYKPDNVFIDTWIPQQGVLAHPNIKLFIYQGGMLSTEEAIHLGVPILGIPVFVDQWFNIRALMKKNITIALQWFSMTKHEIKSAIHEVISNPIYKENIRKMGMLIRDRSQHPLDELIWWTEYIIRHKGAPHLQSPRLPLYVSELWDIYAFILAIFIFLLLITYKIVKLMKVIIRFYGGLIFNCTKDNHERTEKIKKS